MRWHPRPPNKVPSPHDLLVRATQVLSLQVASCQAATVVWKSLGFPCLNLHPTSQKSPKVTQGNSATLEQGLPKVLVIWLPLPSCDLKTHTTTPGLSYLAPAFPVFPPVLHGHINFPGHHFYSLLDSSVPTFRICSNDQRETHEKAGTAWYPKKGQ